MPLEKMLVPKRTLASLSRTDMIPPTKVRYVGMSCERFFLGKIAHEDGSPSSGVDGSIPI